MRAREFCSYCKKIIFAGDLAAVYIIKVSVRREWTVFASKSDWFIVMFTSAVIGQINYFGF